MIPAENGDDDDVIKTSVRTHRIPGRSFQKEVLGHGSPNFSHPWGYVLRNIDVKRSWSAATP